MEKRPLIEHLEELRRRLFVVAVSIFVLSIASFFFAQDIYEILKYPALKYYPNLQFVTLSPSSAFFVLMKISLISGIVLSFPVIFYEAWKFIEPGLLPKEKRLLIPLLGMGILLFTLGVLFAYFVVLPVALKFLIGIGIDVLKVTPMISIDLYTSFILKLILAFGFLFQLPIVMYVLTWKVILPLAGALGIGLGFGLQTILNNYVSGFIMMFSKNIKVGDFVEIPGSAGQFINNNSQTIFGRVEDISILTTRIKTLDGIDILVPNSTFIGSQIINYTFRSPYVRIRFPFGVAYSSNPKKVKEILLKVASDIISQPAWKMRRTIIRTAAFSTQG